MWDVDTQFTDRRAHLLLECNRAHLQPQHSFEHGCNKARHCLRCSTCPEDQALQYVHILPLPQHRGRSTLCPSLAVAHSPLVGSVMKPSRITPTLTITRTPRHWSHISAVSSSDQVSGANGHHRKVALNAQSVRGEAIILQNAAVLIPFASLECLTVTDEVLTASVLHGSL